MLFFLSDPGDAPAAALLYRHDAPLVDGARLVWIDPGREVVKPNKGAYAALPLAIIGDVALVASLVALTAAYLFLSAA